MTAADLGTVFYNTLAPLSGPAGLLITAGLAFAVVRLGLALLAGRG